MMEDHCGEAGVLCWNSMEVLVLQDFTVPSSPVHLVEDNHRVLSFANKNPKILKAFDPSLRKIWYFAAIKWIQISRQQS